MKIRYKISPHVAETIFNSMIHPLFFYCYPILGGLSNTWNKKIESLLTRAKQVIGYKRVWPTWSTQMKLKIALDVFKALSDEKNTIYQVTNHSIGTRGNKSKPIIPRIRNESGRKLSYYQGVLVYNSLPLTVIKDMKSLVKFKIFLKNHDF